MYGAATLVLAATLAAVIVRQLAFRGPPVWLLFVLGAVAMVATGALPPSGALEAVVANAPVPLFLLALFVLAGGLEEAGALERLASWVVARARAPRDVPFLLFLTFGALSAFVVNDAVVLVGVPVALAVARRLGRSPRSLLLTLMMAVTVGSVATPFGNPQNLLVSLESGVVSPVATFARFLAIPTGLSLLAGALYVRRRFARETPLDPHAAPGAPSGPAALASTPLSVRLRLHPTLVIFPVTIAAIVASDLAGGFGVGPRVPLYAIALVGASASLLLTPARARLVARVDVPILVLFVALFVVVAGAVAGGVLVPLGRALAVPGPGDALPGVAAIVLQSLVGSQLVSNVPWVALQLPLLRGLGYGGGTPLAWMALAGGSTLAGNLTLLGAASNLIVVERAERAGHRLGLGEFVRTALPVAAISVSILLACLWAGL